MFFSLYMLYDNEYITLIEESRSHIVSERLFLCSVSDSTSFCDLHIVALCILRTERKKKKKKNSKPYAIAICTAILQNKILSQRFKTGKT